MKKQFITWLNLIAVSTSFAQLPVSTTPQNKKVVLEEFTGVYCGNCPDAHKIGTNIYNADPTNVVLINIHTGFYANVYPGEPDFTTPEGNAIAQLPNMGITGYPAGCINRIVLPGSQNLVGMASHRSHWVANAALVKAQAAYCNVAIEGTIDVQTRLLTVRAEVHYTSNAPVNSNSLNIVLLESKIPGPQTGIKFNPTNCNPDSSYNHNHTLRHSLTGNYGITIPVTTAGTTFTTTQTYTIPDTYGALGKTTQALLGRMELAAFVTETNVKTINAALGPINLVNFGNSLDIGSPNLSTIDGKITSDKFVCAGSLESNFKFVNYGSTPVSSAVFSYWVNSGSSQTYTWTNISSPIQPHNQSQPINLPAVNFPPSSSNTLNITVLSVNGAPDQNKFNDTIKHIIPLTPVIADSLNMQMDFTQDRFGSQSKWTVYDEANMSVIATDGPWPDLVSPQFTELRTKKFTINPNTCYKLVVTDIAGNGVYSSYTPICGGYFLKSGKDTIISNPEGRYKYTDLNWFKSADVPLGVITNKINDWNISIYPNPASNIININIEMAKSEKINVSAINSIGQIVYEETLFLNSGNNTIKLNSTAWPNGLYNVKINSPTGNVTRKLTVYK